MIDLDRVEREIRVGRASARDLLALVEETRALRETVRNLEALVERRRTCAHGFENGASCPECP